MKKNSFGTAALLTAIAAISDTTASPSGINNLGDVEHDATWGLLFRDADRSERKENRMALTDEEKEKLATLCGREKKQYVKFLREKYSAIKKT